MVLGLIALFWPLIQNAWTRMRLRDRGLSVKTGLICSSEGA